MSDIASQHVWSINSVTQGAKQLRRMKTYDVSDESTVETRNAVGSDEPIGFVDKPGGKTITFETYQEKPKPEVDWRKLKDAREIFSLTRQVVGGERVQYPVCRVSKIGPSGDDEGEHMISVEIVALGEKRL
jgi:hypothetical protein